MPLTFQGILETVTDLYEFHKKHAKYYVDDVLETYFSTSLTAIRDNVTTTLGTPLKKTTPQAPPPKPTKPNNPDSFSEDEK